MVRRLLVALAVVVGAGSARAADPPKDIDLVLCLDVSNSMDGLIVSAKARLWDVVNELARAKPTPNLRVGLYSYGHTNYDRESGWVRKELDLTVDLDAVYAKLTALTTGGGTEYVARVSRTAIAEQKWSAAPDAVKIVFVCGNEAAAQDREVPLASVGSQAKEVGVIVNTIYCGRATDGIAPGWAEFAKLAGGQAAAIDQEKGRRATPISTPFDGDILKLNDRLNGTYVALNNKDGDEAKQRQVAGDAAAAGAAPGAAFGRAASKAGALYRNSAWDLVDRMKDDPKFDLSKIKEEELPEELKKLKPEERLPHLKKKAEERAAIQKEIGELSAKRQKHIDAEAAKAPKSDGEKALDEALKAIIREQAGAKGFTFPAEKK